jgi:hypothetical protein
VPIAKIAEKASTAAANDAWIASCSFETLILLLAGVVFVVGESGLLGPEVGLDHVVILPSGKDVNVGMDVLRLGTVLTAGARTILIGR